MKKYFKIIVDGTNENKEEITYFVGFNGKKIHANQFVGGKICTMKDGDHDAENLVIGENETYDLLTLSDSHKILQFKSASIVKMKSNFNDKIGGKVGLLIKAESATKTISEI